MMLYLSMLAIGVLFFITSTTIGIKAYKRKKRNTKIISLDGRKDNKRKYDNLVMLISLIASIFSAFGTFYTLFTSVPSPTIYPLNNEARVYDGTAEVYFDTSPLLTTYYSLDGSDPKDGYKYTGKFTITETTTVVARNRFLYIFWSKPEHSTYKFENVQNTIVTYVDENIDYLSIKQILFLSFFVLAVIYGIIQKIRGEK